MRYSLTQVKNSAPYKQPDKNHIYMHFKKLYHSRHIHTHTNTHADIHTVHCHRNAWSTEKACPERKVLSRAPNPDRVGTPRRLADSDSWKVFHVYILYNTKIQIMSSSQRTTSRRHDTTTIQLYYRHD